MRKLVIGASIVLILSSAYGLQKTVFASHQIKPASPLAVAATPTPTPDMLLASATPFPDKLLTSTTPTPDPIPQSTPAPAPASTFRLEPLKSRVVEHQPDQFRQGALSEEELAAIKKAIETIPWSRNPNPQAAAREDYAAILKECEKSGVHGLLTDLIAEAVSNDYQPNNEAANLAYSTELNADFESNEQGASANSVSTAEVPSEQPTNVVSGLTPAGDQPGVPANATSGSVAQSPTPAVAVRPKVGHLKHRSTVRPKVVDAKVRLIELWHQSLAETEKTPKGTRSSDSHKGAPKKRVTPSDTHP